jgi:hypothetical protein
MKNNARKISCLLLLSSTAFAETNGVDINISAASELSDNATRESLESEKIEERQNTYAGAVNAHFSNQWMLFASDYNVMREDYLKDSQEGYTTLEGKTKFVWGGETQPFSLQLGHMRTSLLNSPDAINLNKNRDERTILSVEPSYKLQLKNANLVLLKASVMESSYRDEDSKKAQRSGLDVAWERGITKVDRIQLVAQHSTTKFDAAPDSDYQYENISVLYAVTLNSLQYLLKVGQNRAEPESNVDSVSHPSYQVEVNYKTGNNLIRFSSEQRIDDTSFGRTNQSIDSTSTAAKAVGLDLINIQASEISWTTKALCERCDFTLRVTKNKEEYNSLSANNNDDQSVGARLSYRFSRAATISVDGSRHERSFTHAGGLDDFDVVQSRVAFNYALLHDLKLSVFVKKEDRSSNDLLKSYDENITGLSLSYSF